MQRSAGGPLGVVLVNLGSPEAPTAASVGRFLRAFLGDRRVVEVPRAVWWFVLNLIIVPFRGRASAAKYRSIWWPEGSPLTVLHERQAAALQASLDADGGREAIVHRAVTYGAPTLAGVLDALVDTGVDDIVVLPLYPQYSATTTASVSDQLGRWLARRRRQPRTLLVRDYCDDAGFLDALAASVREYRAEHGDAGKLLMSFHGIPQRNVDLGDPYRAQCERTARGLAVRLGLADGQWAMSFQSRLGRAQWLKPYTSEILAEWAADGVASVQVICPAFSTDCLETLEEIAVENREVFVGAGGRDYGYIPCLNDRSDHIAALAAIVRRWARAFAQS